MHVINYGRKISDFKEIQATSCVHQEQDDNDEEKEDDDAATDVYLMKINYDISG